jgi:hypothetical protein
MEFVFGLLTTIVLFVVIGVTLYIGYKIGSKKKPIDQLQSIDDKQKILEQQQLQKDFVNLMNYDVTQAYGEKVGE